MSMAAGARRRIEEAHRYGPSYRGGLASHYPMAISALDAMGATDEDLARFDARYLGRLEPIQPAVVVIEEGDEAAHLGSPRAFPEWVVYFGKALARDGTAAVLRRWVGRLTPAVAAGAFHGAIRTAFAVERGDGAELAHALGYWASVYRTLPAAPAPSGTLAPLDVLRAISRDPARAGRRDGGRTIMQGILGAARSESFAAHAASLDAGQLTLDALARAVLQAYAATGDFALLHGVTGVHAFRVLSAFADDADAGLQDLWGAVVAASMGAGASGVDGWGVTGDDTLPWPEIHARAVRRDDEHDIKLAYSCWREWQHRGDDLYRRAASARVS